MRNFFEKYPIISILIIIAIIALIVYLLRKSKYGFLKSDFASCLKSKGIKLYGGPLCPKTRHQRTMFGEYIKNLPYIECESKTQDRTPKQKCQDANIKSYPTWVFPNGQRTEGKILSFEEIKQYSGCDYGSQAQQRNAEFIPDPSLAKYSEMKTN